MAEPKDDWPERIGLPVIEECRTRIDFVVQCLSAEQQRQVVAKKLLREALEKLYEAKAALT